MKEFIPSQDFVKNTMASIRRMEQRRRHRGVSAIRVVVQYIGAASAVLIGIVNLIRLLATVYAPVICR
jgi:hypothetical protein